MKHLIIFKNNDFNLSDELYGFELVDNKRVYDTYVQKVIEDYGTTEDMVNYPEAFVLNADKDGLIVKSAKALAKAKKTRDDEIVITKTQQIKAIISTHIREKARSLGYDDENSIATYAATTNPFQTEALKFIAWKANCWSALISEQAKTTITVDTVIDKQQVISLLPSYTQKQ